LSDFLLSSVVSRAETVDGGRHAVLAVSPRQLRVLLGSEEDMDNVDGPMMSGKETVQDEYEKKGRGEPV
jgi:hypothetical protein